MIIKKETIKKFHKQLNKSERPCLGYAVETHLDDRHGSWWGAARGTKIAFKMYSNEQAHMCFADRARGGPCPVLDLSPTVEWDHHRGWAGWYEEWESAGSERFELVGASWTFFWGPPQTSKVQLFRAEWDNLNQRGENAAQPHWHIDQKHTPIILPGMPQEGTTWDSGGELVELPADPPGQAFIGIDDKYGRKQLELSDIHLGMGGWHHGNHAAAHPGCWQQRMGNTTDLWQWAVRALEHAMAELVGLN